jgi:threonine dehydrogenase-like Zn-dependent dehydrogenase
MRAAGLDFTTRAPAIRHLPELSAPGPGEVLFRVREVGVCGTDRELAAFHFGAPPEGEDFLVLGHEAVGQVEAAGPGVAGFAKGDWVAPMVRRECLPACRMCHRDRRDLCETGRYRDRGVLGAHGYMAAFAVDRAEDLVALSPEAARFGVLVEPLSVVEKAVETALRLHPGEPRTALVVGAGPIGLLAAMSLATRGLAVAIHSKEPRDDVRARIAEAAGARYIDDAAAVGMADIAIEAAGAAEAAFLALARLRANGVCGLLGARPGTGEMPFRRMVLENQTVFGSVNASRDSALAAAANLARFDARALHAMLRRVRFDAFPASVTAAADAVKTVHIIE